MAGGAEDDGRRTGERRADEGANQMMMARSWHAEWSSTGDL